MTLNKILKHSSKIVTGPLNQPLHKIDKQLLNKKMYHFCKQVMILLKWKQGH